MTTLTRLQDWYISQCDGDWEHQSGVRITTIDNPGWGIDINIAYLDHIDREEVITEYRSDSDWIDIRFSDDKVLAHCGPLNLEECLNRVLDIVFKT